MLAGTGHWLYDEIESRRVITHEEIVANLATLAGEIQWSNRHTTRVAQIELDASPDIAATLPPISEFPMVVDPPLGPEDVAVEIFVTTQRSGTGPNALHAEVARAFNESGQRLENGRPAKVKVRKIASGEAYEFIVSKKYVPDAFSPVHRLWIEMAKARGVTMTPVRHQTVRSIAGVVMKSDTFDTLRERHGEVNVKSVIHEVASGDFAMGYTNPFVSSTGLNFLVTVLSTFAEGDEKAMLSPAVVSAFEQFQRGVPFVALTTLHMRESVRNNGSLDAFILGNQTLHKTTELHNGYEFIPFGIPHDHPLYAVGHLTPDKLEVLEQFATFSEQDRFRSLARTYGFNQEFGFNHSVLIPSGDTLLRAQQLWKDKKDAGVPISAVFVCDVSGSMEGSRISAVRESLIKGSDFITPDNSIGLVLFSSDVTTVLPIKEFKLKHKGAFHAAVQDIRPGGSTAMYDAVVAGLQMLVAEKQRKPGAKLMMFVLTDGETNEGLDYEAILPVVRGLKIPIFTIGYEADLAVLQQLSSSVEAASINTSVEEVAYKIGTMLNAQM